MLLLIFVKRASIFEYFWGQVVCAYYQGEPILMTHDIWFKKMASESMNFMGLKKTGEKMTSNTFLERIFDHKFYVRKTQKQAEN